jgi:mannitol/fructose-specific phosphotransferase system IIA component (Ntr-type)
MAEKIDPKELASFRELLTSQMAMLDALTQLMVEKGVITDHEFFDRLKQVQAEYKSKRSS